MDEFKKEFFENFPEETKQEYACFADCSNGEPCVWDNDRPEDCTIASKGTKKKDCPQWKLGPVYDIPYFSSDIWNWLDPKIQSLTQSLAEERERVKELEKAVYEMYWEHDENGHLVDEYSREKIDTLLNGGTEEAEHEPGCPQNKSMVSPSTRSIRSKIRCACDPLLTPKPKDPLDIHSTGDHIRGPKPKENK
jgi:hypothetical protein